MSLGHCRRRHRGRGAAHAPGGLEAADGLAQRGVDQPVAGGHGAAVVEERRVLNDRRRPVGAPDHHREGTQRGPAQQGGDRLVVTRVRHAPRRGQRQNSRAWAMRDSKPPDDGAALLDPPAVGRRRCGGWRRRRGGGHAPGRELRRGGRGHRPVRPRVTRVRGAGSGRARGREDLVGLLTGADQLVLLAGDATDLAGIAEVLLLLRQRGVLLVQRPQLGFGAGEVGPLAEEGAGGEPGEEDDGGHHERAQEGQARPPDRPDTAGRPTGRRPARLRGAAPTWCLLAG